VKEAKIEKTCMTESAFSNFKESVRNPEVPDKFVFTVYV
jgi:hypothetical protein